MNPEKLAQLKELVSRSRAAVIRTDPAKIDPNFWRMGDPGVMCIPRLSRLHKVDKFATLLHLGHGGGRWMKIQWGRVRLFFKKRSVPGWFFWILAGSWKRLGDWQNVEWLASHFLPSGWNRPVLHPNFITISLIVAGFVWFSIVLLWPKGLPHSTSLRQRAFKIRDEMQKFLDSMGEQPNPFDGETDAQCIARVSEENGRRWNLLGHQYELNFAPEISRIYHEFGVRGIHDDKLEWAIKDCKKEEDYKAIIESLTRLAGMPKAENRV